MRIIFTWLWAIAAASAATGALKFEQNKGQTSAQYSFLVKARGQTMFLGKDSLIELHGRDRTTSPVRMRFPGSNSAAQWISVGDDTGVISYLVGKDRSKWVHEAHQYGKVERKSLYPGVDLVMYGDGGSIEYDLVLSPRADASRIRLQFDSAWPAKAAADGAIKVKTPAGTLVQKAPRIYQGDRPVKGRFIAASNNEFKLALGEYDHAQPLMVDPVIEQAQYYGGELDDQIVVVGTNYVAGNTASVDFQGTLGTRRGRNIFLQFSNFTLLTGFQLLDARPYNFILGGSDDDELTSAAPNVSQVSANNQSGYLFLAGSTKSQDLPTAPTGLGSKYGGGDSDGFILRFSMSLRGGAFYLVDLAAAYWGGSGTDRIEAIAGNSSFVVTGSTTSADFPVYHALQPALAGGKDAFVSYLGFSNAPLTSYYSSYLGGTGDDVGWSIVLNALGIYVGGETQSPDFPLAGAQQGSRKGASDGFFSHFVSDSITNSYTMRFSRLIGGSGDDAVKALGVTPSDNQYYSAVAGSLAISGVTSSPDFPVLNAAQAKLAGGTDAFLMRYQALTDETIFSTYWGGSGDDGATAASIRFDTQFIVAGNTRSSDLPLKDPTQSTIGGGQDGFVALLSESGQVQFSSYYGGAGDENIRSVMAMPNGPLRIGGDTTSADLPGLSAAQEKDGGVDGFTADIGVPIIVVPERISAGKGMGVYLTPQVSQTNSHMVTIRTLDPAKVRLFDSVFNTYDEYLTTAGSGIYVEAQQDNGEAQLEIAIDGFPAKRVTVVMYPMVVVPPSLSATYSIWQNSLILNPGFCAFNPAPNQVGACGIVRPAMAPTISYTSSDPNVASVQPDLYGNLTLQFLQRGTATITTTSNAAVRTPAGTEITVTGMKPTAPARVLLGKDYVTSVFGSYAGQSGARRGNILARTSDPSLVRVLSPYNSLGTVPGTDQISYPATGSFTIPIEALADQGEATITLSHPDWDSDVNMVVELRTGFLGVSSQVYPVPVGSRASLYVGLGVDGAGPAEPYYLRAGVQPIPIRITTSDPAIAAPVNELTTFANNSTEYDILGKAAGSAVLSVESVPAGAYTVRGTATVTVGASPPIGTLTLPKQITVGKDLEMSIPASYSGDSRTEFTITVADPLLALISTDYAAPGKTQLMVQGIPYIWVQALASSGSTQVNIRNTDGSVTGSVTVNLVPSGFGFSVRTVRVGLREPAPYVYILSMAVDPSTAFPIATQSLRPGATASFPISVDGTSATSAASTWTAAADTSSALFTIQALDTGLTVFALGTPDGFVAVPRKNRLEATVVRSLLNLTNHIAVQNAVTRAQLSNSDTIRVESGDPARMLLSNTPADGGVPSITVARGQDFFMTGLTGTGSVLIRVTGPGFEPLDEVIQLVPLTMALTQQNYTPTPAVLNIQSGAQPAPLRLAPTGSAGGISALAPGVTLAFTVGSSAPAIADAGAPSLSLSGTATTASIPVSGKSAGTAIVSVQGPSGVTLTNSSMTVNVTLPKFTVTDTDRNPILVVAKDLVQPVQISSSTSLADNKIVTVTSLNPDLLQVSRTGDAPGSTTTAIVFSANTSTAPFFLQGLAGSGTAQILIKADGFADVTATISLIPLSLTWGRSPAPPPIETRVGTPALPALFASGGGSYFRPGAPPYSVQLTTDPPDAATVTPDHFTLGPTLYMTVSVAANAVGAFDVVAALPDGTSLRQPVKVSARLMNISCFSTIGQDMATACSVNTSSNVSITVTSSDPSLLLSSASDSGIGSGVTTIDSTARNIWVQALGASGKPSLLFQAPGYEDVTVPFTLQKTGFGFNPNLSILPAGPTPLKSPTSMGVTMFPVNGTIITGNSGRLRPGAAPIVINVASSKPDVVVFDTGTVTFQSGDSDKQFNLKPGVSGISIITIFVPQPYTLITTPTYIFQVP